MKSYQKFLIPALLIVFSFGIFNSCKKDDGTTNPSGNGTTVATTISGRVTDENNSALSGVTVSAYGQTTTTNQHGTFVLKNIQADKNRCVINFSKSGFFDRTHCFNATANTVNYVNIVLVSNGVTQTFPATAATTVTLPDNSSVQFSANSFALASTGALYTGTVSIALKHLSPDDVNFGFSIPGGDLMASNATGQIVQLYSYGMLGVELTGSSGEKLQLASGKTATITMPVANIQTATAPSTIPLWYFNETASIWMEQGQATRIGNNYVGTVSHFSWWNYDYQGPRATIQGKVVDCEGTPVPNINVTVNGWYVMTTDQNGFYSSDVPDGMTFTIQVLASNNTAILSSQLENIPSLTNGQVYTVVDLVIPCPSRIAGTIKKCNGEITDGIVMITNGSSFSTYQYTLNGSFNLPVIPNSQLTVNAYSLLLANETQINSLSAGAVLNMGDILLCDTMATALNSFTVDGGPFSNQTFNITDMGASYAYQDSLTFLDILVEGTIPGYTLQYYNIVIYSVNITPGYYGFNNSVVNIAFNNVTSYHGVSPYTIFGGVTITEFGPVGGRVKGYFSGDALIDDGNQTYIGTYSGTFDVPRTP